MNRATRALPERADLEQYKKQAKELVQAHGAGDRNAAERILAFLPRAAGSNVEAELARRLKLSEAQLVLARELGFASWPKLKQGIELLAAERGNQAAQIEAFKSAVELGDAAELRRLVARYPSLAAELDAPLFSFGAPAIVRAKQDRELVSALLELGADINARSDWHPGSFGVLDENTAEMAEFLVQHGARLDLHSAAQLGKLEAVKEFLAAVPELVHARGPDGKLPLHVASTPEIVDYLLDHGADIEARDLDHVATAAEYQIKNLPVLRRLIERGARCDAFMAAALGDIARLERVLSKDPSAIHAHAPTMVGETSEESGYDYPQVPEGSAHIYTWSLGFGWSVPHTARALGHREAYEYLLQQLPLVDQLAEACLRLDPAAVARLARACPASERVLSRKKADLIAGRSLRLRNFDTPERGEETIGLYLDAGFSPNAEVYWGFGPLHWIAWLGHAGGVRRLLEAGADPNRGMGALNAVPLGSALHGCFNPHPDYDQYLEVMRALLEFGAVVDPKWLPTEDPVITRLLERGIP